VMDLTSSVQATLKSAGYQTGLSELERLVSVWFEDESIMGFVSVFTEVASLLQRWRPMETAFLQRHAGGLRASREKSWNVYGVFLSTGVADTRQAREVRSIEEDLERTRKLAATGITTREELIGALLPILPLQYQPRLEVEDVASRLQRRLTAIAPSAADVALDEHVPAEDVIQLLRAAR
jgi:hypothetical protein